MKYNEFGEELPDDTPLEAPVRFRRPPSIQELIAMHVRSAMQVERLTKESDDEDDFEENAEMDDILTPYELHAAAGEASTELRRAEAAQRAVDRFKKGQQNNKEKGGSDDRPSVGGVDESAAEGKAGVSGVAGRGAEGSGVESARSEDSGRDRGSEAGAGKR